MDDRSRRARARLAAAHRYDPDAVPALTEEYVSEAWRARVEEVVAAAPPLTEAQRAHIRGLLAPVIGRVEQQEAA